MFFTEASLRSGTWQAFERSIARLMMYDGFDAVRLVGQTGDRGADVLASRSSKRWLVQAKHWKTKVGLEVVDETMQAMRVYRAQVPVIVALNGFEQDVYRHQQELLSRGIPLQLWDMAHLIKRATKLPEVYANRHEPKPYQEDPIQSIVHTYVSQLTNRAMVVMATGLGKTYVAAEAIRRIQALGPKRVLVIAHTNELVYQLERAFWPFLKSNQSTRVWNGNERANWAELEDASIVFGCLNTVYGYIERGGELPDYDIIIVDECHHAGAEMYNNIFDHTNAGQRGGPFLIGLTATPWRADETDLRHYFGVPLVSIDIVEGLKKGFLANIDYRMYTDNINWPGLASLDRNRSFSPRQINRTLFINEWDDAVVYELQAVWGEQANPRAIVFCGTIDHAITMRDRLNALGFCYAAAIYSQTSSGKAMNTYERNRVLCDFGDGIINVVCAVDIFNEGIDVPDVNIIVFQRVTHSRRIFVQQLGRGLRVADGKDKVIVLDFVSDIRRFAAGLEFKSNLGGDNRGIVRISLPHKVTFKRVGGDDPETESFLREWINDVAAVENADEDASVLQFPPHLPGGRL